MSGFSLHPSAQVVEEVDARDETEEALLIHHDRHVAAIEDREQRFDRRLDVDQIKLETIAVATGSKNRRSSP